MEDTDLFLVNRPGELKTYKQEKGDLMAKLQDSDLLLVNRDDTTYKITGAEFKNSITPDPIDPEPENVLIEPAALSGTGTYEDPYILRTSIAAPAGVSISTEETITFFNQAKDAPVIWNTSDPIKFRQPVGTTDQNGEWSGQIQYKDDPEAAVDETYQALLQVESIYFKWTVNQYVLPISAPEIDTVSVSKTRQGSGGGRYTDCDFEIEASMINNGVPTSTKSFVPKFQGVTSLYAYTGPVDSYNSANSRINFADPTPDGFDAFSEGDAIVSVENQIDYGSATDVSVNILLPGYACLGAQGPYNSHQSPNTGTITVPDNANFCTIILVAAGGGSQGYSANYGGPPGQGENCAPGGGGGGGGCAYINNVACTPGETFSYSLGAAGGPRYQYQDVPGFHEMKNADTSTISGSGWSLTAYGGTSAGISIGASQQAGGGGGSYSASGSSGAGAIYTGSGGGNGGTGGTGYRLSGRGSMDLQWPFSMGGGGGGGGGLGCSGGNGGNGYNGFSEYQSPAAGGFGGGWYLNTSQTAAGGLQGGGSNSCFGGSGGGGARGPNNGGTAGGQAGLGGGAGGPGHQGMPQGYSSYVACFFSGDGGRSANQNINMDYLVTQKYEYTLTMGSDFTDKAYSLKVGDYLYNTEGGAAPIKTINGNVITVETTSNLGWTTAGTFFTYKSGSGTISTISNIAGARYFELTGSNDGWISGQTLRTPNLVAGDGSTIVYGTLDSDGETINGLSLSPTPYPLHPDDEATSMTVKFPETWDSGNAPDSELPDGTTFAVDLTATNSEGSDTAESNPFSRSLDVLTFNSDDSVQRMSDEDNTQLRINAATYEVRTVAAKKAAIDAALLASGVTQQQLDDTYGN